MQSQSLATVFVLSDLLQRSDRGSRIVILYNVLGREGISTGKLRITSMQVITGISHTCWGTAEGLKEGLVLRSFCGGRCAALHATRQCHEQLGGASEAHPVLAFIEMIRLKNLLGFRAVSRHTTSGVADVSARSLPIVAMHSKAAAPVEDEILVEEGFATKTVVLNRPKKLNAVTLFMVVRLRELYERWEKDKHVRLVIIKGAGRGFCAGGDVATVYHLGKAGNKAAGKEFFAKEYLFNYILGTYKKIHVALLNGVVMGGGNGVSMHGMFRVATENSLFAMPETAIGLHPDVGASYFLPRLPGHLVFGRKAHNVEGSTVAEVGMVGARLSIAGEYLGLTGARLDGADMLSCGLATHFVPSQRLAGLEERLGGLNTGDAEVIGTAIDEFCDVVYPGENSPLHQREAIDRCFEKETVEEILRALETEAQQSDDEWYKVTLTSLKKASPISLKVSLRSIREGRQQSFHQCLEREYRLSAHAVDCTASTDMYEGCRALLVDKDNSPKWDPPGLEEVTVPMVDHLFAPLEQHQELQLPVVEREGHPKSRSRARL